MSQRERRKQPPLVVSLGELVWDHLPTGTHLGGAACNVAFHTSQMGGRCALLTTVGGDEPGQRAVNELSRVGVDTTAITILDHRATGAVAVTLETDEPRFRSLQRPGWEDTVLTERALGLLAGAEAFVFGAGTAGAGGLVAQARAALAASCLSVCDLNLRWRELDPIAVARAVTAARVVKMNAREFQWLNASLGRGEGVAWLLHQCGADAVIVTDGKSGSYWYRKDVSFWQPPVTVASHANADPLGAGDAFCAALVDGLVRGWSWPAVAAAASRVGALVASREGATPHHHAALCAEH